MLANGLLDEVRCLLEKYRQLSRTAMQAVGYKEPIAYLHGEMGESEMTQQIIFHTRQFVRRQEMWLRSLEEVRKVEINNERDLKNVAQVVIARPAL